jgi:Flp pilus assembly pilin Flp
MMRQAELSEAGAVNLCSRILDDRDGTAAIEYALTLALISMLAVIAVGEVGQTLSNVLSTVDSAMTIP